MLVMNKIEEILDKHKTHSSDLHLDDLIAEDIITMMKEYADYCMNKLKDEIFIYGSYDIDDPFGGNMKKLERWIENFNHE